MYILFLNCLSFDLRCGLTMSINIVSFNRNIDWFVAFQIMIKTVARFLRRRHKLKSPVNLTEKRLFIRFTLFIRALIFPNTLVSYFYLNTKYWCLMALSSAIQYFEYNLKRSFFSLYLFSFYLFFSPIWSPIHNLKCWFCRGHTDRREEKKTISEVILFF